MVWTLVENGVLRDRMIVGLMHAIVGNSRENSMPEMNSLFRSLSDPIIPTYCLKIDDAISYVSGQLAEIGLPVNDHGRFAMADLFNRICHPRGIGLCVVQAGGEFYYVTTADHLRAQGVDPDATQPRPARAASAAPTRP